MKHTRCGEQLNGFMILSVVPGCKYRGVDRNPFEPVLLDEEIDPNVKVTTESPKVWEFYPQGWRREAYKLFESESVVSDDIGPSMLKSLEVAKHVMELLPSGLGPYEIMYVSMLRIDALPFRDGIQPLGQAVGYDVAYPGGDYYSAVRNTLLDQHMKSDDWRIGFRRFINEYSLFTKTEPISDFLTSFRRNVPSEDHSEFVAYRLILPRASLVQGN